MSTTLHRLWHAQHGACWYCGVQTWFRGLAETKHQARIRLNIPFGRPGAAKSFAYRVATIEHLKRRADGGTRNDGIVMACRGCNTKRGERSVAEHKAAMLALVAAGTHPSHFGVPPGSAEKSRRRKLWEATGADA